MAKSRRLLSSRGGDQDRQRPKKQLADSGPTKPWNSPLKKYNKVLSSLFPVVMALCLWQTLNSSHQSNDYTDRPVVAPPLPVPSTDAKPNRSPVGLKDNERYLVSLEPTPEPSDLDEVMKGDSSSSCRFVMSKSMLPGENSGWGIFSLVDVKPNDKLLYSDMRIQLVDVQNYQYDGISNLLNHYSWKSKYGSVEGTEVQTVVPGMSSLSNTGYGLAYQAVPGRPTPPDPGSDDLATTRAFPGVGASTHYHGRQFFANQRISKGQEILVSYGHSFVAEKLVDEKGNVKPYALESLQKPLSDLQDNGLCLDNIVSGPSPGRGRGAFATRDLPKGTVVAPLPVLALNRTSLDVQDTHRKQLLLNYCYGHENSTLLLFSYSPVVNYINSIRYQKEEPNAVLKWSDSAWNLKQSLQDSAQDILSSQRWGLLLELVAVRDIAKGEQVLIDYGRAWHEAWAQHVLNFKAVASSTTFGAYNYASRLNQLSIVRTEDEQARFPYLNNVETSCMYQYSETTRYDLLPNQSSKKIKITQAAWLKETRLVPEFLRPCRILERSSSSTYTVEVLNDEKGSPSAGTIPPREQHIVYGMPRLAIEFTDKLHSTDQNLAHAFRHDIGLPEGVFPKAWMDLVS